MKLAGHRLRSGRGGHAAGFGLSTPPGLLGGALLFWGWETGLWVWAIPCGVALEAIRLAPARLSWDTPEFNRLWDITMLMALGVGIYLYSSRAVSSAVLTMLQWLPPVLFLFVMAQAGSNRAEIDRRTFLWLLRPKADPAQAAAPPSGAGGIARPGINVGYPYFAICVLAASAANARDFRFYAGVCVLLGYALWMERPRRASGLLTAGAFLAMAWCGFVGQRWLSEAQAQVENKAARWLYGFAPRDFEENEGLTAIGRIGGLKLSGRIVLEVEPELPEHPPKLLRQACYNRYSMGVWYGLGRAFAPVREELLNSWVFAPGQSAPFSLTIAGGLRGGRGLLSLPAGAARITELPVGEMDRNRFGTVRVAKGPEFARYRVHFRPGLNLESPPDRYDYEIPKPELAAVARVADELRLGAQPPAQALRTVGYFFQKNFEYVPFVPAPVSGAGHAGESPLSRFLARQRAGHCEYFASAAVLLLRQAGIPARYATGFAVQESARYGRHYLVRERHAHAWALAYIRGQWLDFDATPVVWEEREDQRAGWLRPLRDWWTLGRFQLSLWQWTYRPGDLLGYALGLGLVLLGIWGWRHFPKRRRLSPNTRPGTVTARAWPGEDSEFYQVEAWLRRRGYERQSGETFAQWLQQVPSPGPASLLELLGLHYRYRFDPQGLTPRERTVLAESVRAWLDACREREARR